MKPVVELRDVCCDYGEKSVLRAISLTVQSGTFSGLIGPSGSGKSTLMKTILGKIRPSRGHVHLHESSIGYVPQVNAVDWTFPVTVEEVVRMGLTMTSGPWPWVATRLRQRVTEMLERLGLEGLGKRHIAQLSGGQQQRVFLARALIAEPTLLLLDEPTTGLDIRTREEIVTLLGEIHRSGVTILMTSHELNAVASHLPWIICLNGTIVAQGKPEDVFTSEILSRTYGAEILVARQNGVTYVSDALRSVPIYA